MSNEKHYSSEKNVQILLALLKANKIRKIVASPGTTNMTIVGSLQSDPWFEMYSSVDERSAAYIACGLAAESGEPVMLTCTGATASRNYYPGMTEAFYRKLPVLAVTAHQGADRIGQLVFQNVDRSRLPNDVARMSVELPVVKDERDEAFVTMQANRAILELTHNGGGPVHINLVTTYSRDFSVKELPAVRVMRRVHAWDEMPAIPKGRIGIYVGSHTTFSKGLTEAIDRFCGEHDGVVICDHTSGYYGRYRVQPTLLQFQRDRSPLPKLDLMIHIGEVSAATHAGSIPCKEIWRVSEDGELRDPFKMLTTVFQMSPEAWFRTYARKGGDAHGLCDEYRRLSEAVYADFPELPFGNMWAAQQLSQRIPKGSIFHLGVSNTRRCWNLFPLPEGVESSCNVGVCGIDGCMSSLIGASLAAPDRICYIVLGDLTFFYDLNSLGNRHVGRNVRVMLINNGIGAEFRLYTHPCFAFGEEGRPYMAAEGHFGHKSPLLVKHYAEDLGFRYLSASNKEEFLAALDEFTAPAIGDRPIIFEVFTTPENENEALKLANSIRVDHAKEMAKSILGQKGIKAVRSILGK